MKPFSTLSRLLTALKKEPYENKKEETAGNQNVILFRFYISKTMSIRPSACLSVRRTVAHIVRARPQQVPDQFCSIHR